MTDENRTTGIDHPTTTPSNSPQMAATNLVVIKSCKGCGSELHEILHDDWPITFEWSVVEVRDDDTGELEETMLDSGSMESVFCSQDCWRSWVNRQVNGNPTQAIFVEGSDIESSNKREKNCSEDHEYMRDGRQNFCPKCGVRL